MGYPLNRILRITPSLGYPLNFLTNNFIAHAKSIKSIQWLMNEACTCHTLDTNMRTHTHTHKHLRDWFFEKLSKLILIALVWVVSKSRTSSYRKYHHFMDIRCATWTLCHSHLVRECNNSIYNNIWAGKSYMLLANPKKLDVVVPPMSS